MAAILLVPPRLTHLPACLPRSQTDENTNAEHHSTSSSPESDRRRTSGFLFRVTCDESLACGCDTGVGSGSGEPRELCAHCVSPAGPNGTRVVSDCRTWPTDVLQQRSCVWNRWNRRRELVAAYS